MKPEILSSHGVRLIRVAPGSFIMGSPEDEVGRAYWEQQRHQRIIRILVARGADTSGALDLAQQGLAGRFEDIPPPEAYREIVLLLRELGVQ